MEHEPDTVAGKAATPMCPNRSCNHSSNPPRFSPVMNCRSQFIQKNRGRLQRERKPLLPPLLAATIGWGKTLASVFGLDCRTKSRD